MNSTSATLNAKKPGKILVVDDEDKIRSMFERDLGRRGYEVLTAENGLAAVRIYQESWRSIGLVILDGQMPIMNGRDCFIELKKINPDVQVIVSSAYDPTGAFRAWANQGLVLSLPKPFSPKELLRVVERAFGS